MIRVALFAAMLGLTTVAARPAPPDDVLAAHLRAIAASSKFAHSSFGLAVYDLDSGRTIFRLNDRRFFLAASTTKLLTEGTTLHLLGPRYRFRTNVYRTGPIDPRGTLNGDVVLVASGDPNLSGRIRPDGTLAYENEDHSYDGSPDTKAVPGDPLLVLNELARQIASAGIKRITGRVIVDDSLYHADFPEPGTGAVVSPIMVNDNIVDVTVTPGAAAGDPVRIAISPQTPYASFVNRATTAARDTDRSISLDGTDAGTSGAQTVTVTGSLPVGSPPILYAYDVPSPRRFAEMALTARLQAVGVDVAQTVADEGVNLRALSTSYTASNLVASHASPPLAQDVKVTLKVSDNLHADTMPYLWSGGDLSRGFALERAFLSSGNLDSTGVVQSDGLGGDAFIQPAFMVRYLAYLRRQPFFATIAAGLPDLGVDGTLFNIQNGTPAAGKVFAKTGTWGARDRLNRRGIVTAKGLAGYMTARSGAHLAFCFYVNNFAADHGVDGAHVAGELLGSLATATYLYAHKGSSP